MYRELRKRGTRAVPDSAGAGTALGEVGATSFRRTYFGSGEEWDETKFKACPAGTFYSEPPKAPHYTRAKDGEVIIQITGVGPSGKTFIKK